MGYFKYTLTFLNSLTFATSSYTELDNYLGGVVKGYLSHNQGFLPEAPSATELADLKTDIQGVYSQMLLFVKPKYEEVKRLTAQATFTDTDTTVNNYGDITQTGSFYEPKVNNTQAQINTNGNLTEEEDDTTTLTKVEHRTLDDQAVKDFFADIKEDVELYFIDFVNTYIEDDGGISADLTQVQMDAINSGITASKVTQITTNQTNITALQSSKQDALNSTQLSAVNSGANSTNIAQITTNQNNISNLSDSVDILESEVDDINEEINSAKARLDVDEANIQTISNKIPLVASSSNKLVSQSEQTTALANKQDKLTAGTNITIDANNVISAVGSGTINDGVLTIQKNGTNIQTFSANQSTNVTANITVPTQASDIGAQPTLSIAQQIAVDSGIDSTKVAQITTNQSNISTNTSNISTLQSDRAKTDASNISVADWKNKCTFEQVDLLYDKDSSDSSINWGYTSGMGSGVSKTFDFSKYKYLRITATNYTANITYFLNLKNTDLTGVYSGAGSLPNADTSGLGALVLFGKATVPSAKTSITVYSGFLRISNNTISSSYYTIKIEGVY